MYIISDIPSFSDLISQECLDDRLPIPIILHRDTHGVIDSLESLVWVTRAIGERLALFLLQTIVVSVGMGMGGGNPRYEEGEQGDKCACAHDAGCVGESESGVFRCVI